MSAIPSLFFLVGPTAVGKSSLAVAIASEVGAEIVNADAFQIYRGLDVLTAKPDVEAQRRVPHHLLGAVELNESMSAMKFRALALKSLDEICARGKTAVVVSGSGLYLKALRQGFDRTAPPDPMLRKELSALSAEELAQRLTRVDPEAATRTDLKNPRRVLRALEIAAGTGLKRDVVAAGLRPQSNLDNASSSPQPLKTAPTPTTTAAPSPHGVFLTRDRDDLYTRIDERVLAMFREGVEKEVSAFAKVGSTAAQALGLREIRQLLAGEISRDDCIAKIQQATRRYAKRQLTWFRHQTNFPQLNLTALSPQEAVDAIVRISRANDSGSPHASERRPRAEQTAQNRNRNRAT